MRKCLSIIGLFAVVAVLTLVSTACDGYVPERGELAFSANSDGTAYVVRGRGTSRDRDLVIPDLYKGKPVIGVDYGAFSSYKDLKSVVMQSGMEYIGPRAFAGCTNLTSVVIPDGVTKIGYRAFRGCSELSDISLPDSVIDVEREVFEYTAWYDALPDGLVYAGKVVCGYKGDMPEGCSIELKEGDTKAIAERAFSGTGCENLTSLSIPKGVEVIPVCACDGCKNLTSVSVGEGVVVIGACAFRGCTNLERLNFKGTGIQWLAIRRGIAWKQGVPESFNVTFSESLLPFTYA